MATWRCTGRRHISAWCPDTRLHRGRRRDARSAGGPRPTAGGPTPCGSRPPATPAHRADRSTAASRRRSRGPAGRRGAGSAVAWARIEGLPGSWPVPSTSRRRWSAARAPNAARAPRPPAQSCTRRQAPPPAGMPGMARGRDSGAATRAHANARCGLESTQAAGACRRSWGRSCSSPSSDSGGPGTREAQNPTPCFPSEGSWLDSHRSGLRQAQGVQLPSVGDLKKNHSANDARPLNRTALVAAARGWIPCEATAPGVNRT